MLPSKPANRRLAEVATTLGLVACLGVFLRPSIASEPAPKPLTEAQSAQMEQFLDRAKTRGSAWAKELPKDLAKAYRSQTFGGFLLDMRAIDAESENIQRLVAESERLDEELGVLESTDELTLEREEAILRRQGEISEELNKSIDRLERI